MKKKLIIIIPIILIFNSCGKKNGRVQDVSDYREDVLILRSKNKVVSTDEKQASESDEVEATIIEGDTSTELENSKDSITGNEGSVLDESMDHNTENLELNINTASIPVIDPTPKLDTDFDGLSDEFERESGTNPMIANIPKIYIFELDSFKIKMVFAKNPLYPARVDIALNPLSIADADAKYFTAVNPWYEVINLLHYQDLKNAGKKIDLNNKFNQLGRLYILPQFEFRSYHQFLDAIYQGRVRGVKKYTAQFNMDYKVGFDALDNVSKIGNIEVSVGFFDRKQTKISPLVRSLIFNRHHNHQVFNFNQEKFFNASDVFNLHDKNIDEKVMLDYFARRPKVALSFDDFEFTRLGIQYKFRDFKRKIKKNNAQVIISTPHSIKTFFVSPQLNLKQLFTQLHLRTVFDSESQLEQLSIGQHTYANNISTAKLFNRDSEDKINEGAWRLLGPIKNGDELLKKNKTYIVSYATTKTIMASQMGQRNSTIVLSKKHPQNSVHNLKLGDEIEFNIRGSKKIPLIGKLYQKPVNTRVDFGGFIKVIDLACRLNYIDDLGERTDPLHFRTPKLTFVINGVNYKYLDLVGDKKNFKVTENGQNLKFRLKISEKLFGQDKKIQILMHPDKSAAQQHYGYRNRFSCQKNIIPKPNEFLDRSIFKSFTKSAATSSTFVIGYKVLAPKW